MEISNDQDPIANLDVIHRFFIEPESTWAFEYSTFPG